MRQAGRYLPEYLEVRSKVSFNELCRTPRLIAEVVRQPVARFGFDAAILFSDILTMLDPMGIKFEFPDGGPRIEKPFESPEDINQLGPLNPEKDMPYVMEGLKQIKQVLPDTPLIGFCGSPFTLACYLIEGKGSKTFDKAKKFLHQYPEAGARLLNLLADAEADYLKAQVKAGADAVQIFQSWDGILSREDYRRFSFEPARKIMAALKDSNVPRILFVNNLAPYIDLVAELDCEVVGVDYRTDLAASMRALPGKAVQGNLDPSVLFGPLDQVKRETARILDSIDDYDRLIFNLGHGILPKTPLEAVATLVETVHSYRRLK
jgi:uroporphyrinogen decarboxylase